MLSEHKNILPKHNKNLRALFYNYFFPEIVHKNDSLFESVWFVSKLNKYLL
jgi:hypothetical protein